MKKWMVLLLMMVTVQAFAVDIARRDTSYITVDVITNTTGGAYENFEIISVFPNIHKVVVIRPNGRYQTEFCNQVDKNSDTGCDNYDPEPIFADWDAAQAANNVTLGTKLTTAEQNQYMQHWFYQMYVANDLNGYYNEMIADAVLTDAVMRDRYFGTCRAYEFNDVTCADFVTVRFDTGRRPRTGEMSRVRVPNRFIKVIRELRDTVVDK